MTRAPALLLLAAGAGARMRGRDKLLEEIDGVPLLRRQAEAACSTGAPVIVALPRDAPARVAALDGMPVSRVEVEDAASGMAASLVAACAAAPEARGVMIVLCDMPELTGADLSALIAGWDGEAILRAAAEDGTPGHPVIFPADLRPELLALRGDTGARDVLRRHAGRIVTMPLPGRRAVTDLDTPEAWEAWRRGRN
ncbi:CTP:molybdopterin cytidylyltransferase MocA [Tranquillimonas rosea]|uniref:CTP:molybdopterin cytidylyltransferase MocA n=1 Tax=Tranquillimonas rosea TaxID=641238 RepID=A0A1H9P4W5_9RHOB|nr:nucleotidyltransferase family protein [Tranquillimonas rosea]SER43141.1 CTP:molybdopterin cytidylyltransferase MocA [Tranquillimonas rosea]